MNLKETLKCLECFRFPNQSLNIFFTPLNQLFFFKNFASLLAFSKNKLFIFIILILTFLLTIIFFFVSFFFLLFIQDLACFSSNLTLFIFLIIFAVFEIFPRFKIYLIFMRGYIIIFRHVSLITFWLNFTVIYNLLRLFFIASLQVIFLSYHAEKPFEFQDI